MLFIFSSTVDDLSYNKTSTQSSTMEGIFYEAKNAVDGLVETCMRTHPMGFNSPYISVWWKVDLGGIYNIFSISILFKNYDGYGIEFFTITLLLNTVLCSVRINCVYGNRRSFQFIVGISL